jgi:hypothetical protein
MSDPNNALRWLLAIVCCPPPLMFILGVLAANAVHRGWIQFDPSRAPRFGKRRDNE